MKINPQLYIVLICIATLQSCKQQTDVQEQNVFKIPEVINSHYVDSIFSGQFYAEEISDVFPKFMGKFKFSDTIDLNPCLKNKKDYLKQFADDIGLKTFQLEVLAQEFDRQREINTQQTQAELAEYRRTQAAELKENYGENFEYNRQQANKLLRTPAGARLLREFEGEKFLSSKNFVELLLEKIDGNIQGTSSNRGISKSLSRLPTRKLSEMNERLVKSKWNDSKYKDSTNRSERIKYNKVTAKIAYLDNLLSHR